jgi:glyceraldehyde-3-phosphate dehydrogenase/erythrose-4-phosphate dehydrogenase
MQGDRAEGHSVVANGGQRDAHSGDLRRARAAAINVVPTSTRFGVAPSNNEALPVTPQRLLAEVPSARRR